jgi:hypothetical protein
MIDMADNDNADERALRERSGVLIGNEDIHGNPSLRLMELTL